MIVTLGGGVDAKRVARNIHGMGRRAEDARPLWRSIAPVLLDAEERTFRKGFSKAGGSNRPRRARYTLIDTGRLRKSLVSYRAPGQVLWLNEPQTMRYGTNVFYAKFLRKRGFKLISIDRLAREEMKRRTIRYLIRGHR